MYLMPHPLLCPVKWQTKHSHSTLDSSSEPCLLFRYDVRHVPAFPRKSDSTLLAAAFGSFVASSPECFELLTFEPYRFILGKKHLSGPVAAFHPLPGPLRRSPLPTQGRSSSNKVGGRSESSTAYSCSSEAAFPFSSTSET